MLEVCASAGRRTLPKWQHTPVYCAKSNETAFAMLRVFAAQHESLTVSSARGCALSRLAWMGNSGAVTSLEIEYNQQVFSSSWSWL